MVQKRVIRKSQKKLEAQLQEQAKSVTLEQQLVKEICEQDNQFIDMVRDSGFIQNLVAEQELATQPEAQQQQLGQKAVDKEAKAEHNIDKKTTKQLQDWQRTHLQNQLMKTLPLMQRGLSAESLVGSIGMVGTMYALSPAFRQYIKDMKPWSKFDLKVALKEQFTSVKEKLTPKFKERLSEQMADDKYETIDYNSTEIDESTNNKDETETNRSDNQLPLIAKQVALIKIGLAENAQVATAMQGADPAKIKTAYARALENLDAQAKLYGVNMEEVKENVIEIMHDRLERDPQTVIEKTKFKKEDSVQASSMRPHGVSAVATITATGKDTAVPAGAVNGESVVNKASEAHDLDDISEMSPDEAKAKALHEKLTSDFAKVGVDYDRVGQDDANRAPSMGVGLEM